MKKLFALLIVILLVLSSGEVVRAQYNFPDNPALDQVATGPGGQQFKWDGVKWVALLGTGGGGGGLTFVGPTPPPSPPVGQLWFDTTNVQTYLWYNDGTSSQWVAVVNIAGGGGAYLPLAGGTMTGPINNVTALGIGAAAPTTAGTLLQATANGDFGTIITVSNNSSGTGAASGIAFKNDAPSATDGAWLAFSSTTFTAQGSAIPADSLQVSSNGVGGLVLTTNAGITPGPPISFWSGNSHAAIINGSGLVLPNIFSSSLAWGSATAPVASIAAVGTADNLNVAAGAHYNGTNWIADATTAQQMNFFIVAPGIGQVSFEVNDGLTVGNAYTPNLVASFNSQGLALASPGGRLQSIEMNGTPLGNGLTHFFPSVTGQTGGSCTAAYNDGWASRVGNLVTVQIAGAYTCTGMNGYLQFQGFPWANSNSAGNVATCAVEAGNLPLSANYSQFDCQVLQGWAGCLPVETGNAVPAQYYFANWVPAGQWTMHMTCNYLVDF